MDNHIIKQDAASELAMINDVLCTVLSEVQALRCLVQEQDEIITMMYQQLQTIGNDVLQLRASQQTRPTPIARQHAIPTPAKPLQGNTPQPQWDKRNEDYPESIFERPRQRPSFKIPNKLPEE